MTWMRLDATVREHRKVGRLARLLGIPRVLALGHLTALWTWVLTQAPDGALDGLTSEDLADACWWEGEPDAIARALVDAGLLDVTEHGWQVHGWAEHAESLKAAQRMAKKRETERAVRNSSEQFGTVTSDETRRDETRRDHSSSVLGLHRAEFSGDAPGSADADPTAALGERQEGPKDEPKPPPAPEVPPEPENAPDAKPEALALIPLELPPAPAVWLRLKGGREVGITTMQVAQWSDAYPGVDVRAELLRMRAWLDANPAKRPASSVASFAIRWLGRAQNDAASRASRGAHGGPPRRLSIAEAQIAESGAAVEAMRERVLARARGDAPVLIDVTREGR